jgi:hypothetical protein
VPLIVIVIVIVAATVSPPGQIVAVLSAVAAILAMLGFRKAEA